MQVLRSNKRWFEGVSLVVISNTLWVGEQVPCLTYGMRGMISLSIEVRPCAIHSPCHLHPLASSLPLLLRTLELLPDTVILVGSTDCRLHHNPCMPCLPPFV